MITSYEAFIRRVKIDDTFYIVPIEVEKALKDLDAENEKLKAEISKMESQKNADDFETAEKIICNLKSDRMGTSKVLVKSEFDILDAFWAELEERIVYALNNKTINGTEFEPSMLPKVIGAGAEEFLESRRKRSHWRNDADPELQEDPNDPIVKRKKRREVTIIQ